MYAFYARDFNSNVCVFCYNWRIIIAHQWTDIFDPPEFGYFKYKSGRGHNSTYYPAIVLLQDGDRDEHGDLESDQQYMVKGWPHLRKKEVKYTHPISFEDWCKLKPIEKEEFEWLMELKTL